MTITDENKKRCLQIIKSDMDKKLLYDITKIVAETDSIGEAYGEGPDNYTKEIFEDELRQIIEKDYDADANYIMSAGLDIFDVCTKYTDEWLDRV